MRTIIPFNDHWLFAPHVLNDFTPDAQFEPITLPHTNIVLPHHNFDNQAYQFVSTYRKRFSLPAPLDGRRAYLDFDGALTSAAVSLNGHKLGEHDGGFTPFSFDITEYLRDGDNLLTVYLDSTEREDIPPYGYVVDYLTFGGIYREVSLRLVAQVHIADVFVQPYDVLTEMPKLDVAVTVRNESGESQRVLVQSLLDFAYDLRSTAELYQGVRAKMVEVPPHTDLTVTLNYPALSPMALWTLEQPTLHELKAVIGREDRNDPDDEVMVRFGLREARFDTDGSFYLNGQPLKLRGLNRHQTYPFIGAAAPRRLQRRDADIIKYELGCNIVRTSHYPQSPHFIERCDEIGLLVFEEIPGWQFTGDEDWQALTLRDVEAMIKRDRNHPSIIIWGVRINESLDHTRLYKATNDLAHKLDPTRQTGGVRYFQDSEFLEDVFTFNDFSNGAEEPLHTPHLITEFAGHKFPTKTVDAEERQIEHALRHARIQDGAAGNPRVSGAIGWCAFDYNTHVEFGSGDRICYHGVMDMFRLPKFAAWFYESQLDPSVRPVLRPATSYAFGDRNDYSKETPTAFVIFSNCDEIEVFLGERSMGRFLPDRASFPHLAHPPFQCVDNEIWYTHRLRLPDVRFVGYVGGQVVIEDRLTADRLPKKLTLTADDAELFADGADMTRLTFKIEDADGHRLPFSFAVVTFTLEGDAAELIGTNPFPLVGGQAALYLKARHQAGSVTVTASTPGLAPAAVTVSIMG